MNWGVRYHGFYNFVSAVQVFGAETGYISVVQKHVPNCPMILSDLLAAVVIFQHPVYFLQLCQGLYRLGSLLGAGVILSRLGILL